MDFASALANLEKSAQEASRSSNNSYNNNYTPDHRRRPRASDDYEDNGRQRRRHQDRQQHPTRGGQHHDSNNNNNNPLMALQRLGYCVAPYRPLPPLDHAAAATRPKHVALLAITIDDLPYEHIWKTWAAAADSNNNNNNNYHVSLLCHAKFPLAVTSPWLQRRLLIERQPPIRGRGNSNSWADPVYSSHTPSWGSVQITRAMIDLVREALEIGKQQQQQDEEAYDNDLALLQEDVRYSSKRYYVMTADNNSNNNNKLPESVPPVDKMIFISETCLPVVSLEHCMKALFAENQQWPPAAEVLAVGKAPNTTTVATPKANNNRGEDAANDDVSTKSHTEANNNNNNNNTIAAKLIASTSSTDAATTTPPEVVATTTATAATPPSTAAPATAATTAPTTAIAISSMINKNPYETSWVNARNLQTPGTPHNMYERQQFTHIHGTIPPQFRCKSDQWLVLSRPHAAAVAAIDGHFLQLSSSRRPSSSDQLWNAMAKINASDEMYFATALALLQILTENDNDNNQQQQNNNNNNNKENQFKQEQVMQRPVTFTDWSEGMRNPASYRRGIADFKKVAKLARAKGCLMARKFVVVSADSSSSNNNKSKSNVSSGQARTPTTTRTSTGQITAEEWKTVVEELERTIPLS